MKEIIKFHIPDFYYHYQLDMKLIELIKENPNYFYDNTKIGSVYGSFPGAIWNGGRAMFGIASIENIKNTIDCVNNVGVPVRFTFTNCLLEEKHVYDTYCNLIMEAANNGFNEVLVNSDILEEYLRRTYPNFKYISSTTKCERDINKINDASNKYDLVVTDYRDNCNYEFLNEIKNKNKIELLVNASCSPNCGAKRQEHYSYLSKQQLMYSQINYYCDFANNPLHEILKYPTVIKVEDIYGKYYDMGFSNFKIEGRTEHKINVIESYIYYLVKPEYKDIVRHELIKQCWE